MRIILETIGLAWAGLCETGTSALATGIEAEVNALLEPRLNHLCQSQPLWKDLVHSVHRGRESVSYNGKKLENRPDISLSLTSGNPNFPLNIECKIINYPNGKTVKLYCDNGIVRFIEGDYAWAREEAIMLAYVRDGSTILSRLAPYLANCAKSSPDPMLTVAHPVLSTVVHPIAHASTHSRSFSYLAGINGDEPGPIRIWHLWVSV